jgi:hypothetical protein
MKVALGEKGYLVQRDTARSTLFRRQIMRSECKQFEIRDPCHRWLLPPDLPAN